jgi:ATP-dependent Clp protease ATP-binding subunit ClpX
MDDFHCSFCGKRRADARHFIAGPRVFICDACVAVCVRIVEKERAAASRGPASAPPDANARPPQPELHCSFCNKPRHSIEQLIHGGSPGHDVYICNECLALSAEIVGVEMATQ